MNTSGHLRQIIDTGTGPFFFYDLDALSLHLRSIRDILDPSIKVWYACKANPLSAVLETLKENGFGVDVASLGELAQAQAAGLTGSTLIATGPAKSSAYLNKLIDAEVSTIIIESPNQLKWLNDICGERQIKKNVLLRVQLDWPTEVKSVLGGSAITPFGMGTEDWKKVTVHEFKNLSIKGLHCFQWGNILELDQLRSVWDMTLTQCRQLCADLKVELKIMDLGGGLGVSYQHGGPELGFGQVHKLLLELKTKHGIPEIWLELGRYTMANYGTYATQIIDIKSVRGKNLIVTEGGINHIARPALTGEAFPGRALTTPSTAETKLYNIHGPLCTALDFLGEHRLPADLRVGDWVVFEKTGAYGFTESMPYFLCHVIAAEYAKKNDKVFPLRGSLELDWLK